jgi:hypothetical protein
MTGRLSEEAVVQSLDTGWQSLVWQSQFSNKNKQLLASVDIRALLESKDPEAAIQAVPRRDMYVALVTQGPEDALDVLPYLSQEQFVSIIDHEAWHDGTLAIHQAIRWLDLFRQAGTEQLYRRFRELDEEYQVALLNPFIEMKDEESFELLGQEEQDQFTALPCNTLWWRVKGGDDRVTEFVTSLISASLGEDTAYVYSLLGMAAMLPPNEQEALLKQFRDARLEEDGFVSADESRELFLSFDGAALYEKWKSAIPETTDETKDETADETSSESHIIANNDRKLFIDRVIELAAESGRADREAVENLQQGFAFLANALAAACRVEPDDINGVKSLLTQGRCLVSFGLETLSGANLVKAVDILFTEYPKTIFRFALSLADSIRLTAIDGLKTINEAKAQKILSQWRAGKFGAVLWNLDRDFLGVLDFESVETLKGIFNRFPLVKSEIITSDGAQRARFRPLETTGDFTQSMNDIRKIFPMFASGGHQ